jgi:large subunit ribosomal protein L18
MSTINRKTIRQRIHSRIRRKVTGTAERPRLAVHYSNQHIYAQVIDDSAAAPWSPHPRWTSPSKRPRPTSRAPRRSANSSPSAPRASNISAVVFDRGGHLYHGKVKALADAAREGGLQF